jgi:arginine/ornithine N-succinyltransferase beta subunit
MTDRVPKIGNHIRECVAQCNPHTDPKLYRVYQEGFVLGHLASIFDNDPIMYREFLEHCEKIAQTRNKKIDTRRR